MRGWAQARGLTTQAAGLAACDTAMRALPTAVRPASCAASSLLATSSPQCWQGTGRRVHSSRACAARSRRGRRTTQPAWGQLTGSLGQLLPR